MIESINLFTNKVFNLIKVPAKIIFLIFLIATPPYLLKTLDFRHVAEVLEFLRISWWPIVALTFIFLFKNNISRLIDEIEKVFFKNGGLQRKQEPQQRVPEISPSLTKAYHLDDFYKNKLNNLNKDLEGLKNQLLDREIELDFERIFIVIFGSQIKLLKHLDYSNIIEFNSLKNYYDGVKKSNPSLSEWSLENYLSYLQSSLLIEPDKSDFKITIKGKDFIDYIENKMKYTGLLKSL